MSFLNRPCLFINFCCCCLPTDWLLLLCPLLNIATFQVHSFQTIGWEDYNSCAGQHTWNELSGPLDDTLCTLSITQFATINSFLCLFTRHYVSRLQLCGGIIEKHFSEVQYWTSFPVEFLHLKPPNFRTCCKL